MEIIYLVVIEILELRAIVKTTKVGPGSVFHDMVLYQKNIADEKILKMHF